MESIEVERDMKVAEVDAENMHYRNLNQKLYNLAKEYQKIIVRNVNGQRYIAAGFPFKNLSIEIHGVCGEDLGVFMNGPTITVYDNAQDGVGNTMNAGRIFVHGHAGDVCGYGMRGGRIFILGKVGYRVGIHMKGYKDSVPIIVVGGTAGHFFGEYMAGGILILLGLDKKPDEPIAGDYLGTGMHNGVMYVRGEISPNMVGKEVGFAEIDENDLSIIKDTVGEFAKEFQISESDIFDKQFQKLYPKTLRPYGPLYSSRWLWQKSKNK